jgi:hypothetical protein
MQNWPCFVATGVGKTALREESYGDQDDEGVADSSRGTACRFVHGGA